ncbi:MULTISPECIES: 16S rRNA (cytosine(1402)-N(4))-methyltransferase RsmH [unclassified Apibacter]|uniref:16S rRNA (cytosine(1402)-N(4))-methyltransferase RsmH n=1 Tax=unclassified Apibacter TaxID=2630820 RepID=UPI001323F677|nr:MULTISPECIES: 16S rRNA (cytosine(1402)-N(4))-methyltransferase RsmH [unclassified Apibacter]MCX8677258.1 16S rRNA (cytosine(1402)-N(4))-methyltransferase RsmH [Apibacter sp. B3919]MXO23682.1 16S rRNA (cytosine(1402)-N(4))-methyltransferase RsmH [Apibacter sp. B3924]MXO26731.1 16S rRNA (cytosine(1402)-N(4))-methyltransferase RsmH [Apibacter sp. B3813]MXO28699.1 16S rRNA (cytosine(1402)-N(4))-methyltransferase RsmH [Apibacter sp. B3913]MXO30653.1 16S rRNA (cytosine(1402)-N(4))-methyltransfera
MNYHKPVLLHPSVDALISNPKGIYVDCTFGGGGHSRLILEKLSIEGKLFAFDQDYDAIANLIQDSRFTFIQQNFRYLKNSLRFYKVDAVDGILADLGVSSHQFDIPLRGFSTRFDGPLDMRMNNKQSLSAKDIINNYTEDQLAEIFYLYGELKQSRKISREIIEARKEKHIETTSDLKVIFEKSIPSFKQNKFFAQLFQALRIEVNDELNALKELLTQSYEMLKPGGTLVFISYHSLEDRLVKKFLKTGLFKGEPERDIYGNWEKPFDIPYSKAIIPNQEEILDNTRARSAKMRIATKR